MPTLGASVRGSAPGSASRPAQTSGRQRGPARAAAELGRTALAGAASLGVRRLLDGPPREATVLAVFPSAIYLRVRCDAEPRVVALVTSDAIRLPNAIVIATTARLAPFAAVRENDGAIIGAGFLDVPGTLRARVRRWWDPSPVLGPISVTRLTHGAAALDAALRNASWGLAGHQDPVTLASSCAAGDLASAVDAAERIVGLGPGLTPSGDDVLAGLLLALRLLGGALPGGGRAVWLADWLGAAVTYEADARTTALAATLLHCAAQGEAAGEVAGVLRGIAGQEPLGQAIRRLLSTGHTSGADLAWGLLAGCRSALRATQWATPQITGVPPVSSTREERV